MGVAVHCHHLANALPQLLGWTASRHDLSQAAIKWEIQHALHHRFALPIAHVAFNFAHGFGFARPVDGKSFTECEEIFATGLLCHDAHARMLGVFGV